MKKLTSKNKSILIFILILFCTYILPAQNTKIADLDEQKAHNVELKENTDYEGMKTAYFEGELENGSYKFKVEGLDFLSKTAVNVIAADSKQPIDVEIVKNDWNDVVKKKNRLKGSYQEIFNTNGSFGIKLSSEHKDAKFYLAVFTHKPIRPNFHHIFYPVNEFKDGEKRTSKESNKAIAVDNKSNDENALPNPTNGNRGSNFIFYVIAGFLGAILIVLLLFLRKKGKNKSMNLLLVLVICLGMQVTIDAGARGMSNRLWGELARQLNNQNTLDPAKFHETVLKMYKIAKSTVDLYDALTNDDNDYIPSVDPRGLPSLPSSCYDKAIDNDPASDWEESESSSSSSSNTSGSGSMSGSGGATGSVGVSGSGSTSNTGASSGESGSSGSSNSSNSNNDSVEGDLGIEGSDENTNTNEGNGNGNEGSGTNQGSGNSNGNEGNNSNSIENNESNAMVALYGHVYFDHNKNGEQDVEEVNLLNTEVSITDSDFNIKKVTTDVDGNWYSFTTPGRVQVVVSTIGIGMNAEQTEGNNPTVVEVRAGQSTDAGNDGFHTEDFVRPEGSTTGERNINLPNPPNQGGNGSEQNSTNGGASNSSSSSANNSGNENGGHNSSASNEGNGSINGSGSGSSSSNGSSNNSSSNNSTNSSSSDNSSNGNGSLEVSGSNDFEGEGSGTFSNQENSNSYERNSSGGQTENENEEDGCACLEKAYEDFYDINLWFERLRALHSNTTRKTNAAIAFGDGVSNVHAVSALAWQNEKVGILKSLQGLDEAYDKKLNEFIDTLYGTLQEIDRCEHMMGFEGWYRRAGFIYFEFTKLRYKRN